MRKSGTDQKKAVKNKEHVEVPINIGAEAMLDVCDILGMLAKETKDIIKRRPGSLEKAAIIVDVKQLLCGRVPGLSMIQTRPPRQSAKR